MGTLNDIPNEYPQMDKEINFESKEIIKLVKNTKGYNWEIKLTDSKDIETQIERLERINNRLKEKFGNE